MLFLNPLQFIVSLIAWVLSGGAGVWSRSPSREGASVIPFPIERRHSRRMREIEDCD